MNRNLASRHKKDYIVVDSEGGKVTLYSSGLFSSAVAFEPNGQPKRFPTKASAETASRRINRRFPGTGAKVVEIEG